MRLHVLCALVADPNMELEVYCEVVDDDNVETDEMSEELIPSMSSTQAAVASTSSVSDGSQEQTTVGDELC